MIRSIENKKYRKSEIKEAMVLKPKADVDAATYKLPELVNVCHIVSSGISTKEFEINIDNFKTPQAYSQDRENRLKHSEPLKKRLEEEFKEILEPINFDKIIIQEMEVS